MAMVCGLDLHRRQITFDALEVGSGEEWQGRIWQPDRERFRRWLRGDVTHKARQRFGARQPACRALVEAPVRHRRADRGGGAIRAGRLPTILSLRASGASHRPGCDRGHRGGGGRGGPWD